MSKIQLLVVLGVLLVFGYLASSYVNPFADFAKQRDQKRKDDLQTVQNALESYYRQLGRYPDATENYEIKRIDGSVAEWGEFWVSMTLPKDPSKNRFYVYIPSEDGQAYRLYANVERESENAPANVPEGVYCGENSLACNYGVSSRNVSP